MFSALGSLAALAAVLIAFLGYALAVRSRGMIALGGALLAVAVLTAAMILIAARIPPVQLLA